MVINMRKSQLGESWDIADRKNSMCKGPEMGQTLVSSRHKMRALWLKQKFSEWISRPVASVLAESRLEMHTLRTTPDPLNHRP